MTTTVYLHVGPYKTGTTYVQGLLTSNQDNLAAQGVLYVGGTFRNQGRAVREVLQRGDNPATGASVHGAWPKLLGQVADWHGRAAVISHELIATATRSQIKSMLRGLKACEVHVIYTARDLSRVAPAMWQTAVRSKRAFTWDHYADSLRAPDGDFGPWGDRFWNCQDAPQVLARWRKSLPVEQLHVVTVPRPGGPPELLWERFCQVIGVDPAGHDLQPPRSNPTMGTAESELLRRINEGLSATDIDPTRWLFWIRWLARRLETRSGMLKFTLPDRDLGWLSERAAAVIEGLRAGGYPLVGDLDELVPHPVDPASARHPSDAPDAAVLDAAVEAMQVMMLELAQRKNASAARDDDD